MKLKKRRKSSRRRGTRLCGWAAKKHKGKGNRGGKGMSGTSKQKKSYVIAHMWPYFGRKGQVSETAKVYEEINLIDIERNLNNFIKKGIAKEGKEGLELNLIGYKVLGEGDAKKNLIVKAYAFSNSAKEKIEKAGGKAIVEYKEEKEKPAKKPEAKVVKKEAVKTVKKPETKKPAAKPSEKKKSK
jgi:large subunit ribosomal protein L15